MKFISILILSFALLTATQAQVNVTGIVSETNGATIPGVNITVKGTLESGNLCASCSMDAHF